LRLAELELMMRLDADLHRSHYVRNRDPSTSGNHRVKEQAPEKALQCAAMTK
jgi:hypothetical protein